MESITKRVHNKINASNYVQYTINVQDVIKCTKHLKAGKSEGDEGLMSDHVINAPHRLSVLITVVFNAMVIHGISPESMLIGTMIPLQKAKRQEVCKSDKCRAITLSSIFTKVLDWLLLIKEQAGLCSSQIQFGFKSGISLTHCTMAVQESELL